MRNAILQGWKDKNVIKSVNLQCHFKESVPLSTIAPLYKIHCSSDMEAPLIKNSVNE
jgi:hypothetical protein